MNDYQKVLEANIALHASLAGQYNSTEPHFRPENVAAVKARIRDLCASTSARKLLDLGCGTGFIINIAKEYVPEILGVDICPEMLERVDRTGSASISLLNTDTGTAPIKAGDYDLATAYSFLHHLFDITPTLRTAFSALRAGGKFYVDLEPNYFFWAEINKLERGTEYDQIIKREIEMVHYKDEDAKNRFGVSPEVFNCAEYGKSVRSGFQQSDLESALKAVGFCEVDFFYNWFVGEGAVINNQLIPESERFSQARVIDDLLRRALPVSRCLYKYLGFVATK